MEKALAEKVLCMTTFQDALSSLSFTKVNKCSQASTAAVNHQNLKVEVAE